MQNSRQTLGWYRYIKGYHIVVVMIALIGVFVLLSGVKSASALTTVPTKMNFQGRLTDSSGNIMPNGTYNMRLKLYTVSTAGSAVWSEDRLVSATQGVTVTNGLFSIKLGDITTLPASLFASGELYLEVELPSPASATSASPTWSEGPMTPRNQMATSAYAYNSETLDGLDSAAFGQLSQNNTWSGSNTFSGSVLAQGSLTVGTTAAQGSLVVHDGNGQTATIVVADTAGSYTYTLPVTTGNDTLCLQTLGNCGGAGSGVTTVGALDGGTANANGASITGNTIYLQSASGTYSGLVNTSAQNFAGVKTFNSGAIIAAGQSLTVTGGATGTRPASPTEGMVYYDTTTKQLLTYANGKWQQDRTDAILVAASNSSQADKDAADYVADGNTASAADGDQVQINQALTAGAGKKVVLLAGTYVADATILVPNNTTFAGVGQGTVIELADIDVTDNLIENSDTTTGTGVTIHDMKLDGRNDLNTVGTIHGIYLNNMGGGDGSSARSGAALNRVTVNKFRNRAIYLNGSANNRLQSIRTQTNQIGVYFLFSNNNVLDGSSLQGDSNEGVYLSDSVGNTISNNFTQGPTVGIELRNSSNFNTITGNTTIDSSSGSGIMIFSSSTSNTITGNTVKGNAWGIELSSANNNTISGNTVANNTNYGISIGTANTNVVTGNRLMDNGGPSANNAIYISGSDSNTITGNNITDSSATTTNYAINISNSTSDTNYLADNILGTGSTNDLGTGTIYGGQVDASGNYTIQPAGNINLNKNTIVSAGTLTLGSTTTQGNLVVHDGNGQTGTIRMADTAGSYVYSIPVTTANDTFCLQTLANCGGGGGVTTVGALDGGTPNASGATISGTTMYLQSASATNAGLVNTTTQTFAGNKTFTGTLTVSNSASFTGTLTVGSGGDTASFSSSGLTLAGAARGTRTVTLVPEFLGSTFRGDGTNNTGSLSSDFCSAATGGLSINTTVCSSANQEHNYYEWSNTQATAQDYDIYVRYQVPSNYSTGSMTNLRFTGHGNTSGEAATLWMYQGSTQCATTGDVVTAAGWATGTVASPLGTCTFAANGYVTFKIQLSATQNNQARAGAIEFTYRSTF